MQEIHPLDARPRRLDVLGPTLEFVTSPAEGGDYCVVKGDLPPGAAVPLHSHPDPESFLVISGRGEVLVERGGRLEWIAVRPGDYVNVPGGAKHAHRNTSNVPLVELATTTATLGRFFEEIGRPLGGTASIEPPTEADVERFQAVAAKYGHWLASPEENAAVGLTMDKPPGAR